MMIPSPEFLGIEEMCSLPIRLQVSHLETVAALEALCFAEPWSADSLSLLTQPNGFGFVIVSGNRAVAYGGMTVVLDEGAITEIATHPGFRRRGLGRQIVRALLEEGRKRQITSVFLEVRSSNLAAQALYRSEGFVSCGTRKNFYRRPVEDAILMVWRQTQE